MADETVKTKLELDASQVLSALRKLDDATDTMQVKQRGLSSSIADLAKKTGREYGDVAKELEKIARLTQDTVFTIGKHGKDVTREVFAGAKQEKLLFEIDKLFGRQQGRGLLGQFTNKIFPDFSTQLKSLSDYDGKLKLVQKTIEVLSKKTGSSFKDVGAQLQNAFPELKNTNLVSTALDNLGKKSTGLSTSFRSLKETATQVDLALTKIAASGKLALAGNQQHNLQSVVNAFKEVKKNNPGASFEQIAAGMRRMGVDGAYVRAGLKQVNEELVKTGKNGKSAFDQVFTAVNAVRIALGALVSMLLFQGIQAITSFAKESVKQFTELEDSLFRISAAEKVLSEAGVEISAAGMKKGISELRKELKIFSEEELTKLAGQLAISTKALGFNEEQILALTKAVAIKNKVSVDDESLDQTGSKIVTTLLTDQSKGAANLGIELGNAAIEAKALDMNLLRAGESANDLTEKEKKMVKLQIILDSAAGDAELFADFLETNSAKLDENTAAWEELQVAAGGFFATIIPAFSGLFEFLTDVVNGAKVLSVVLEAIRMSAWNIVLAMTEGKNAIDAIRKGILAFDEIPKIFDQVASEGIPLLFAKMPTDAPEWFKKIFGKYLTDVETATDLTAKWKDELEENDEALKALDELDQKIKDIMLDAQHAQEDLDIKLGQKQEDLDLEYIRKADDAAIDHAHKLEDINQDTLDKIEDAKRKAREEEEKREQDLLQKLKELRERYLLDLEDALHERDARAVLRLMKEYKLDKQNILDRAALDESQRKDDLAAEIQQIEEERRRRIESENIEYQRKLADLATSKAREQEELKVWYQREQEDIKRNIEQKLESLLAGYITEEKLHEEHQGKIYAILSKYFGKDMELMGNLTAFMAQQFAQMQAMVGYAHALGSLGGSTSPRDVPRISSDGSVGGTSNRPSGGRSPRRRMAAGGQFVATRPTTLDVGEGGMPELVSVIPLSKLLGGSLGVNGSGGSGGLNGSIEVAVSLSEGLEAEIVNKAMDGVGEVIGKVNRSK